MNANLSTNEIEIDPRWALAAIVLIALSLSWTSEAQAEDKSTEANAHQFMTGPMVPQTKVKSTGVDKYAIAQAVWSVLKYDSSKLTFEEVRPVVDLIVEDSEKAGIDPFIGVTIVFLESRFKVKVTGDGGRACGMAQQHARFSMTWDLSNTMAQFKEIRNPHKRYKARHNYECELLRDPVYASRVMVYHLRLIENRAKPLKRYVWFYNGREGYLDKHSYWREQTEDVYGRIMKGKAEAEAQAALEAEVEAKNVGELARNP